GECRLYGVYFPHPAPPEFCTLSLHDALPISARPAPEPPPGRCRGCAVGPGRRGHGRLRRALPLQRQRRPRGPQGVAGLRRTGPRSEEHTSELQSRENLVCRLLLEKKKYGTIK